MKNFLLLITINLFLLVSCTRVPQDLMKPNGETLKIRSAQSRTFDTTSDKQLLQASISVLQDMGYTIKESSSEYGVLTAIKESSAISTGQVALALVSAICGSPNTVIDKTQYISASLVVLDKDNTNKSVARTVFQRVIVRTDNSQYEETITDPKIYAEFYAKLDKALFLEMNNI